MGVIYRLSHDIFIFSRDKEKRVACPLRATVEKNGYIH